MYRMRTAALVLFITTDRCNIRDCYWPLYPNADFSYTEAAAFSSYENVNVGLTSKTNRI